MTDSIFKYDSDDVPFIEKSPAARLDYTVDWSDWLATGETISSSVWSSDISGISLASTMTSITKATAWISGGVIGTTYTFRNWIKTSVTREDTRAFNVVVKDR